MAMSNIPEMIKNKIQSVQQGNSGFLSDMIASVSKDNEPEDVIQTLLEFVGTSLHADRAYLFERNDNGSYDDTFEWIEGGVSSEKERLKNIPFEGVIDAWFKEFQKHDTVIIKDIEEYKFESASIYNILKPQGIKTLVAGPIKVDGDFVGFYGVDNPPVGDLDEVASLIDAMSFILSMVVSVKNQNKKLKEMFRRDTLTGCLNRKALDWAYVGECDRKLPITVIMCDINGLKKRNDKFGHESGDLYICRAADLLKYCFGPNNVYRIGGDEFVVVIYGDNQGDISEKTNTFIAQCERNHISVSLGTEQRECFDVSFDALLKEADKKMYLAKREYYKMQGVDRREASRFDDKDEYYNALMDYGSSCSFACRVNLTNDTYELIHAEKGYDTSFTEECTSFSELQRYPVKAGVVHSDDVDDYLRYSSREYLSWVAKENHGVFDQWIRYRSRYGRDEYNLIEVQIYSSREYSDDEQIVYLTVKNMGRPFSRDKIRFEDVLSSLSDNYDSIFYVDLDRDAVVTYRLNKSVFAAHQEMFTGELRFSKMIERYVDEFVSPSDRDVMRQMCSTTNLREKLGINKAFAREHRVVKNGEETFYRVKFTNMDGAGELHNMVVGFANINSDVAFGREYMKAKDTVLVVEDNDINRELLVEILQAKYKVLEAVNGNEAYELLEKHYREVAIVLTDVIMPECDGYEFLRKIRESEFRHVPIIVTTALGDNESKIKCLELGATDFISKPYNERVMLNRIQSIIRLTGLSQTLGDIERDELTGLYTKESFFRYAQNVLDNNPERDYSIVVSDIIGFKALNEQYGKEMGDRVLKYLAGTRNTSTDDFIIGGRINGDIFACIRPSANVNIENETAILEIVKRNAPIANLTVKTGIYNTADGRDVSIRQMCDRAELALASIKDSYDAVSAVYDESMRQKLLSEQLIIDSMDYALENNQFKIYFQPKHNINTGMLNGAEALVRWIHPELGFMNPGLFIPIFERNGFIRKLDRYVWEEVCKEISKFRGCGKEFPISVNVSRRDFADISLADYIIELTDRYLIPHDMLHIEITESAYADFPEQIKNTIRRLHDAGFIIELDDFGTGYSSIIALSSLDIDILKLDMSIIKNDDRSSGKSVLEFSMQLAKMMKLSTIQEGVETEAELERVKELGCESVQGYYYSRPLPNVDFAEYVKNCK